MEKWRKLQELLEKRKTALAAFRNLTSFLGEVDATTNTIYELEASPSSFRFKEPSTISRFHETTGRRN